MTTTVTIPIFMGIDAVASAKDSVASAATRTFAATTAAIAQMGVAAGSGGGVIRKAHLEVCCQTTSGSATTAWSATLAINGGSASPAYAKTGMTLGGTGGWYSIPPLNFDFTTWLAANWPAATASCSIVATVTLTGSATINATAILWITVEYDAASCPTQTKWAAVNVGSFAGGIGTSYVTVATAPQLTGLSTGTFRIPEAGYTLRQSIFELVGDSGGLQSSASLGVPSIRIGGATIYDHTTESTTGAGNSRRERFLVSAGSLGASQTVEMKGSAVNASYPYLWSGITCKLHVVYDYTVSGTTEVLVAGYHYVGNAQGMCGYGSESDAAQYRTEVQVPEASIAAQGPMGWVVNIGDSDHFRLNLRGYQLSGPSDAAGVLATKTAQVYNRVRHSDSGDNAEWSHRVDAGAGAGGASVLAPGFNYFKLNMWASDISTVVGGETYRRGVMPSVAFFYAYNAPVAAAGPHAHAHVIEQSILPQSYFGTPSGAARFNGSTLATSAERKAAPIPASSYVLGYGVRQYQIQNGTAISIILAARQSGKPFVQAYEGHGYGGFAPNQSHAMIDLSKYVKRYPAQPAIPSGGWDPSTDLDLMMCCGNSGRVGYTQMVAFHEQLRTITVAVTGYTGNGSGIAAKVFRADTGELVAEVTTGVGGTATFLWPDSVSQLYGSASQGASSGTSANTTSSTITIPFPTPTTAAEGSRFNRGFN